MQNNLGWGDASVWGGNTQLNYVDDNNGWGTWEGTGWGEPEPDLTGWGTFPNDLPETWPTIRGLDKRIRKQWTKQWTNWLPSSDMRSDRDGVVFQQDGAPSHTAKSMKKWLCDHGITLFPHPPSSPNISPIKCVWRELKKLVRAREHPPTLTEGLIAAVKEAWDMIVVEDIDKYVNRMDDIVDAVLKAKGGHTKY
ncbi:hypothetical protein D9758_002048 [Tetrapyrgos nigripes]|uniref:Tc1-like transposase DDE domain-containing protein n=1 Tax=Tetrapyrgos nigripes TaxID=182062 RepID=A0A8H5GTH7_9AGAR|nr:hypothetical protein D9758_002048 [Tetrapyrgos nigripes]